MKSVNKFKKILALALYLILLVGLPIFLINIVDSLLFTSEDLDVMGNAINGRSQLTGEVLMKVVSLALWLFWVLLIISTVAEVATIKKQSQVSPKIIIPGLQVLVRQATLAIPIIFALLRPATATPLPAQQYIGQSIDETADIAETTEIIDDSNSESVGENQAIYTTEKNDSWYSISNKFYGSGKDSSKILLANIGRQVSESIIIEESTDFIQPGWEIIIPNIKVQTVEKGDTLWDITKENLAEAEISPSLLGIDDGIAKIVDLNNLENPDLIYPGQKISTPNYSDGVSEPTSEQLEDEVKIFIDVVPVADDISSEPEIVSDQIKTTTSLTKQEVDIFEGQQPIDSEGGLSVWALAAGATSIVGSWQLKALIQKRKYRLRNRIPRLANITSNRPPLENPGYIKVNSTEPSNSSEFSGSSRVVANNLFTKADNSKRADLLETACKAFSEYSGNLNILAVVLRDGKVYFIGDTRESNRQDFSLVKSREFEHVGNVTWVFKPPEDLDKYATNLKAGTIGLAALTTVGTLNNGGVVLLNLEQIRSVQINSETEQDLESFYVDIAMQLATTSLAGNVDVVLIGFGAELDHLDRIEYHQFLTDDVLEKLENKQRQLSGRNPVKERVAGQDPSFYDPIVVMAKTEADAKKLIAIQNSVKDDGGIIVFAPQISGLGNLWKINLGTNNTLTCPDLPSPINLSVFTRSSLENKLRASVLEELKPDPIKLDLSTSKMSKPKVVSLALIPKPIRPVTAADLNIEFTVSCLGNIELGGHVIDSSEKPWTYSKTAELIVLIAMSKRSGITRDSAISMLFPQYSSDENTLRRFDRAMLEARALLSQSNSGQLRFPLVDSGGVLKFDSTVGTDIEIFEENLRRASKAETAEQEIGHIINALDLVKDEPFTLPGKSNGFGWDINLKENLVMKVEDAALRVCDLVSDSNPELALQSAKTGLLMGTKNFELQKQWLVAARKLNIESEIRLAIAQINEDTFNAAPEEIEFEIPSDLEKLIEDTQEQKVS